MSFGTSRAPKGAKRKSLTRTLWKSLESLPSQEQIERLITREVARAERNGLHFSLVLFRVKRGGRLGVNEKRLALTLMRRIRVTDEVGWFDEDHLCAILPDTSAQGAQIFADSVCELVSRKGPKPISVVYSFPFDWIDARDDDDEEPPAQKPPTSGRDHDHHGGSGGRRGDDVAARGNRANILADRLGLGDAAADYLPPRNGKNGHDSPPTLNRVNDGGVAVLEAAPKLASAIALASAPSPKPDLSEVKPIRELLAQPMPWWKRAIDIVGASTVLLLASPLLVGAAAAIKLSSPGPIIFTQRRAGLGGKPFTIFKFRTMCNDAEAQKKALRKLSEQDGPAFKLTRDPRVTKVGTFLRKTSIDELPQLFNVLLGTMSLVGPRPLPLDEQNAAETWQQRRLNVTPGLTCVWQIEGRSRVTFAEWVRMDVGYMRRRTIWHDLSIMLRTVPAVLLRRGAK